MNESILAKMTEFWRVSNYREAEYKTSPRLSELDAEEYERELRRLMKAIIDDPDVPIRLSKILEVGCGYGRISARLAGSAHTVVGIDISDGMINEACSTFDSYGNLHFYLAEPTTERRSRVGPFGSIAHNTHGPFGLVVSVLCLQHQPDLEAVREFLEDCYSSLVDRGYLRIQTHDNTERTPRVDWGDGPAQFEGYNMTPAEITTELERAGFSVKLVQCGLYRSDWIWLTARK